MTHFKRFAVVAATLTIGLATLVSSAASAGDMKGTGLTFTDRAARHGLDDFRDRSNYATKNATLGGSQRGGDSRGQAENQKGAGNAMQGVIDVQGAVGAVYGPNSGKGVGGIVGAAGAAGRGVVKRGRGPSPVIK
jgi:hypothetical protein